MLWRLAFPLILIYAPRFIPRLARTVYLAWKLVLDSRVPLLLRLLLPASLIYLATPPARLPYVGPVGFVLVLALAVYLLVNLAPRHVVEGHAPWMTPRGSGEGSQRDTSRVVEGSYRVVDGDEGGT